MTDQERSDETPIARPAPDGPEGAQRESAPDPVAQPGTSPAGSNLMQAAETPRKSLGIAVSALTDVGCVRKNNEDAFGYDEAQGIFVVCDGMGGGPSGELSSAMAVDAILRTFSGSQASGQSVGARLLHAMQTANAEVWQQAQSPELNGMGTTAVAAARDGAKLIIGNVGDSRAYLLREDKCVQITVDHSYVNEMIRSGALSPEDAHGSSIKGMESVIVRAVGVAQEVEPDFYSVELEHGTVILLATDGLTRYLLQDEILAMVGSSRWETACSNLIAEAKRRGGADNITCMLLVVLAS